MLHAIANTIIILLNKLFSAFQSVTVSPPNEAISIDFRPAKLQPELLRQTTVAYISFKGRYQMNLKYHHYKTVKHI